MSQPLQKASFAVRPDLGCARLAAAIAKKAALLGAGSLDAFALPDLAGGLFFEFRSGKGMIQVKWQHGGGTRISDLPGSFSIGEITDHNLQDPIFRALEFVLSGVLDREEFAAFSPAPKHSTDADTRPLDRQLVEDWLIADQTGWFEYRLDKPRITQDGIAIAFISPSHRVSFLLQTNYDAQDANAPPDRAILALNGVRALLTSDTRSEQDRSDPRQQVERFLAFTFSRLEQGTISSTPADAPQSPQSVLEAQICNGGQILPLVFALDTDKAWRQFMADDNFDYFLSVTLQTTGRNSYVWHSDRTCFFMRPFVNGKLSTLINYPWELGTFKGFDFFTTNLSDKDIISDGSENYLSTLLDHCAENGPDDQTIILENTCIPKLLGQDMTHIAKSFSTRHSTPILQSFSDQGWGRHETGIRQRFSSLMTHVENLPKSEQPSINLVGFTLSRDFDELSSCLNDIGIEINANLLPNINLPHARRFKRAWMQVLNPIPGYAEAYDVLFKPTGINALECAAPYGFDRSAAWFERIAEQVDLLDHWRRYRDDRLSGLAEERTHIRERAHGHVLGFIADTIQVGRIWDASRNFGVPLLDMLIEFGFGVVAYLYEDSGDAQTRLMIADTIESILIQNGFARGSLSLDFFSSKDELENLTVNGPAELLFSEYFDDPRIADAGRGTFSLSDFERGFAGAARTFERLYHRIETPYFRKLRESKQEKGR